MTNPSAPDTGSKCVYPSDVEIGTWFQLSTCAHHIEEEGGHISKRARFIAEKACDWQREQDALICENMPYSSLRFECADAIRAKIQEGEQ